MKWTKSAEGRRFSSIASFFAGHGDVREIQIFPSGVPLPDGTPAPDFWAVTVASSKVTVPFDCAIALCVDLARSLRTEVERLLRELYEGRTDLPATAFKLDPDDDF